MEIRQIKIQEIRGAKNRCRLFAGKLTLNLSDKIYEQQTKKPHVMPTVPLWMDIENVRRICGE